MSNYKENKARKLWAIATLKKYGYICARCLSFGKIVPATDAHHIAHKTQGLALRYDLRDGVALCRTCHNLDNTGELKAWCIEHIGQDEYDRLLESKHSNIKWELAELELTMDEYLDAVIKRLEGNN